MRSKSPIIMDKIIACVNEYQRACGLSPSTTEIASEIGIARGTAYTYLVAMREKGLIRYDGKNIVTNLTNKINCSINSTPILGQVVCGDPNSEEENIEEYVGLPEAIFGNGELFILRAYGDSMNLAGIDEGDLVVVKKQNTANEGDLVIALTNNENNLKRISFDHQKKCVVLSPESSNSIHKPKEYKEIQIQGVVKYIIKKAK